MNGYSLIPFAAFLLNGFAWVHVFVQRRPSSARRAYLVLVAILATWALCAFFAWNELPLAWYQPLAKVQTACWTSMGVLFLEFVSRFVDRRRGVMDALVIGVAVIGLAVALGTSLVEGPTEQLLIGNRASYGPLYPLVVISNVILPFGYGLHLLVRRLRAVEEPVVRVQIGLLFGGVGLALAIGLVTDVVLPALLHVDAISDFSSTLTAVFAIAALLALRYDFLGVRPDDAVRQLFEEAKDAIVIVDDSGEVLHANEMARITWKRCRDIGALLGAADGDEVPCTLHGEDRVYAVSRYPIRKSLSRGSLLILRDVTAARRADQERVALEEQLRQSQKMEAMGQLAGGVAHDFNNYLSAIIGYSGLIKEEDTALARSTLADLEEVEKAARKASALTRQLLAFSRRELTTPQVFAVNGVVRDTDRLLRRVIGEDIELVLHLEDEVGNVVADRGQLEQVLVNIAVNARDAMPAGGRLTIETSNLAPSEAEALLGARQPAVVISLTDTGEGMPPEVLDHIFEPFFTTKAKGQGTGLGLSTVYGIIKQAGGEVRVCSTPGEGSTFEIALPSVLSAPSRTPAAQRRVAAPPEVRTVLLVEDEPSVRELARRMLSREGIDVLEAASGSEALEVSQEYRGQIDLLLTDVIMPGMSGRELASRLVASRSSTPVLYMSGYTDDMLADHGVLPTELQLIHKPFDAADLVSAVRDAMGSLPARGFTGEVDHVVLER